MAERGRKTKAKQALVATARGSAVAWTARDAAAADRLTARFQTLREQLFRDAVETMREMGEVLEQGAALLKGRYGRWLEEALGIGRSAAGNYRRVLALSRTTPAIFLDWKEIGPSKMIRLARVKPTKRKVVVKKKLGAKSVIDMTDAEFAVVTKPYVERSRAVTGNMLAHGLRMRVKAYVTKLEDAAKIPTVEDRALRAKLKHDLDDLIRAARAVKKRLG